MFSISTFFELGSIHEIDQVWNPHLQPIQFPFLAHRCKKKTRESTWSQSPINELYDKLLPKDLEFEFYISLQMLLDAISKVPANINTDN